jgi:hypothetical protein
LRIKEQETSLTLQEHDDDDKRIDKIMETLDGKGIKLFVLAVLKKNYLYLPLLLCVFSSVVPVQMHYRLRLVTVRMKVQQNGRLFIFLKRSNFSCAFSWSICNKTDTLIGVSRAAVSEVMTTYTNHGKISGRRKSGRKPKPSEKDRRTLKKTVSKKSWNYGSKGDSRTQYSS